MKFVFLSSCGQFSTDFLGDSIKREERGEFGIVNINTGVTTVALAGTR